VCYSVRRGRASATEARVVVTDAANGEQTFDVGRAVRMCAPPSGEDAPELVCHAIKLAKTKPLGQKKAKPQTLTLDTRYGTDVLRVGAARELCVPALGDTNPPPPNDAFALEVTPATSEVIAGQPLGLTVTALFMDGHTEDYTYLVRWSSSDESVVLPGSVVGAFPETAGLGMAVLTATDPTTGISSADTGGDATVTVTWPLEKLVMTPHATSSVPGQRVNYTVRGFFTGGFNVNLTQKVVYASSNPIVAIAPNEPGRRSRVLPKAFGTTTISATDPISGISTTDSDNDATLRVVGALSYIAVDPNQRYSSIFAGESQRFTAIGYYNDGRVVNLTQQCHWSSSNPAVAAATNPAGDKSRIDGLTPGYTLIYCSAAGDYSSVGFYVMGALQSIQAYGAQAPREWLRNGASVSLTALGVYEGGGMRNLTQALTWASRDPDIAVATNDPGNRSRFVGVDGGEARAFAFDPVTGIVSNDTPVIVLGDLVSLEILGDYPAGVIPVDATRFYSVRGLFEHGSLNLSFGTGGYVIETSDPGVLEVLNDVFVRGVSAGVATLTARDVATGLTSAPVEIKVKGGLASITLTPATATRGIGEWESFTAIGNYPPDLTELLTQRLVYSSSDPSVAVADNTPGQRSRVRTVGAGTATITATDATTGVFATSTITVLPGTIERITIQPSTILRNPENDFSFTAIGHYPDGSTINVTQVVTWTSLDPFVATATNMAGDRSRVVANFAGTAGHRRRAPVGREARTTPGDDATFVVKPLVKLSLKPEFQSANVGFVERYTLVGTFDDQTNINLTQDAFYWTDDPTVVRADNVEGDRSAVEFLKPGSTTLHAAFADWTFGYPDVSGSVVGAFIAVKP
jgi:uncharacterized protein YjdB